MVEAQACGTPVIACRQGAAPEIISDHESGIFFNEQNARGLIDAVHRFEKIRNWFDPERIRAGAMRFSVDSFRNQFGNYVTQALAESWRQAPGPDVTYFQPVGEKISDPDDKITAGLSV
jgi:glycosyltransferase involved in cell wall biosynthesis